MFNTPEFEFLNNRGRRHVRVVLPFEESAEVTVKLNEGERF